MTIPCAWGKYRLSLSTGAGFAGRICVFGSYPIYLLRLKRSHWEWSHLGGWWTLWGFFVLRCYTYSVSPQDMTLLPVWDKGILVCSCGLPSYEVACYLWPIVLLICRTPFLWEAFWMRFRGHPHPGLEGTPVIRGETTVVRTVFKSIGDFPPFQGWLFS